MSSFIADCGSPSDFDSPLNCPDCTMCCNSLQECEVITSQTNFGIGAAVVTGVVAGFLCLVLIASLLRRKEGASLDFSADKDWVYQFVCPRDTLDCRKTSDNGGLGWVFFAVFLAVHLLPDMVNGLKLVWTAPRYGLSKKTFQCLFGGFCLSSISALALYTSVVYNTAISRSNLELIFNTVILLFVNELDEKMYSCLETVSPKWLKITSQEIKTAFSNNNDSGKNTGGGDIEEATLELRRTVNSGENTVIEEIEEAILGHQWRINELEEQL
eukprot:15339535-Ditylum_brightwellii.AAC.1